MPIHIDGLYTREIPTVKYNEKTKEFEVEEPEEDVEGKWMYLFVDLVVVALISKFSHVMERCAISFHSLSFVSIVLLIAFQTRLFFDEYCGRFYSNDLFHRLLYFSYTLCTFVLTINVNAKPEAQGSDSDAACMANIYGPGIPMAFCISRAILLVFYISLVRVDRNCFYQFIGPAIRSSLSLLVTVILVTYDANGTGGGSFKPEYRMYIYLGASMIEFSHTVMTYIGKAFDKKGITFGISPKVWKGLISVEFYLLDQEAYRERLGAFLMMVLGESIIGLCLPYFDVRAAGETYKFAIVSCFIIFLYGVEYYDAVNAHDGGEHAMSQSLLSNFLYTYLHLGLALSFFFTSSGMARCYELSLKLMLEAQGIEEGQETEVEAKFVTESPTFAPTMSITLQPTMSSTLDGTDTNIGSDELSGAGLNEGASALPVDDVWPVPWNHVELINATQLLAASIGLSIIFFAVFRQLHRGLDNVIVELVNGKPGRFIEFIVKFFFGGIHWLVPSFGFALPSYNVFCHAVFLMAMVLYEVKIGKRHHGKKRPAKGGSEAGGGGDGGVGIATTAEAESSQIKRRLEKSALTSSSDEEAFKLAAVERARMVVFGGFSSGGQLTQRSSFTSQQHMHQQQHQPQFSQRLSVTGGHSTSLSSRVNDYESHRAARASVTTTITSVPEPTQSDSGVEMMSAVGNPLSSASI